MDRVTKYRSSQRFRAKGLREGKDVQGSFQNTGDGLFNAPDQLLNRDRAATVIIRELWKTHRQTHRLSPVKGKVSHLSKNLDIFGIDLVDPGTLSGDSLNE